jgi:hypothetical protein
MGNPDARGSDEPAIDVHTHIFCWGEDPDDGFVSDRVRRQWLTRLLIAVTGLRREAGESISEKLRNRLLRQVSASGLRAAVVLAQDAVYRADGSRDDAATHFYVSNDYVLRLAAECDKIRPGCSINPIRTNQSTRSRPAH